jgi:hypothetical protein
MQLLDYQDEWTGSNPVAPTISSRRSLDEFGFPRQYGIAEAQEDFDHARFSSTAGT